LAGLLPRNQSATDRHRRTFHDTMYARLIMYVIGLFCFVIVATLFAQMLTNQELARREIGTSQHP
jgi:hypothetical protein